MWDAHRLALSAVDAVKAKPPAVEASGGQPFPAEDTGAVGDEERRDDDVTGFQGEDVGARVRDDANELVAHAAAGVTGWHRPVRPEVAAADGGPSDTDDGVGGLDEAGVGDGLDTDVACAVQNSCAHRRLPPMCTSRAFATPAHPLKKSPACVTRGCPDIPPSSTNNPFPVILGSRPGKFSLCGPRTLQASIQHAT